MADLSQAQLEELVNGKPPDPRVVFYDQAELDREASVEAGRRVYHKTIYIKITAPGVTDWVAYRAQRGDIEKYPAEYQRYKANQQGVRPASVDIIPGLDVLHLQELLDMGLGTIPQLAASQWVPDHLEYAREAARAIINVLRRTANEQGNGEGSRQGRSEIEGRSKIEGEGQGPASGQGQGQVVAGEGRWPGADREGAGAARFGGSDPRGAGAAGGGGWGDRGHWADGPAPDRQIDSPDFGRPGVADCEGIDGGGYEGLPSGDDEGGQVDLRGDGDHPAGTPPATGPAPTGTRGITRPGNVIDNWKVEFHWG